MTIQLELQSQRVERPAAAWWVGILIGMSLWGLLALNDAVWAQWQGIAGGLLPRPLVLGGFVAVVAIHVGEALYAYTLAVRTGRKAAAFGWLVQTFFLGVPSLALLQKQIREKP
jgi:hypothetical protein